ncbi:MAG: hypothetical protein ACFFER_12170 [Candidatus Thorarchaeota archaeon]
MTDMKRHVIFFALIALLFVTPAAGNPTEYSPDLAPRDSVTTKITWTVIDAPEVAFSLWFSGTGNWVASSGSQMTFEVISLNDDVEGQLNLGNVTLTANDTDIARDLTLGVWGLTPWLPGLVVKIGETNLESLNQTAFASAERVYGNYLNGTMESVHEAVLSNGTSYDCIVFDFEQDPPGFGEPQRTMLAYDTVTGVLVKANTSYAFDTPYSLVLELGEIEVPSTTTTTTTTTTPTTTPNPVDQTILWVGVAVLGIVIVVVGIIWAKR